MNYLVVRRKIMGMLDVWCHSYWIQPLEIKNYCICMTSSCGKQAVAVWHRRSSKDIVGLHFITSCALAKPGLYWYVYPSYCWWYWLSHSRAQSLEWKVVFFEDKWPWCLIWGIQMGDIVLWIHGPFPASMNDSKIFKIRMQPALARNEKVIADKLYKKSSHHSMQDQENTNNNNST